MPDERPWHRVVWRAGKGEARARREAFAALHREHASGVFNLALRMLGNREDAQDVSQDVLLKAYEKLGDPGELNQRAWLHRVTVNACYDHLRARKRKPAVPWDPELELDLPPTIDRCELAELRGQIAEAIRRVPPAQRAALLLREIHGLHNDEVAYALGVKASSAEVTLVRARTSFRRHFLEISGRGVVDGETSGERRALTAHANLGGLAAAVGLPALALKSAPLPARSGPVCSARLGARLGRRRRRRRCRSAGQDRRGVVDEGGRGGDRRDRGGGERRGLRRRARGPRPAPRGPAAGDSVSGHAARGGHGAGGERGEGAAARLAHRSRHAGDRGEQSDPVAVRHSAGGRRERGISERHALAVSQLHGQRDPVAVALPDPERESAALGLAVALGLAIAFRILVAHCVGCAESERLGVSRALRAPPPESVGRPPGEPRRERRPFSVNSRGFAALAMAAGFQRKAIPLNGSPIAWSSSLGTPAAFLPGCIVPVEPLSACTSSWYKPTTGGLACQASAPLSMIVSYGL